MLAKADLASCLGYDAQPIFSKSSMIFYESVGTISRRVIDIGCGTGAQFHRMLAGKKMDDAEVYCLDVLPPDRIRLYKEFVESNSNSRIIPELRYEERIPHDDNYFDTVLHIETLAHIRDYPVETEISEVSRIVKPKGNVFLTAPCSDMQGCEKRSFSKKELDEILRQYGLTPTIKTYTAGDLGIPNVSSNTKVTLFAQCFKTKS